MSHEADAELSEAERRVNFHTHEMITNSYQSLADSFKLKTLVVI